MDPDGRFCDEAKHLLGRIDGTRVVSRTDHGRSQHHEATSRLLERSTILRGKRRVQRTRATHSTEDDGCRRGRWVVRRMGARLPVSQRPAYDAVEGNGREGFRLRRSCIGSLSRLCSEFCSLAHVYSSTEGFRVLQRRSPTINLSKTTPF